VCYDITESSDAAESCRRSVYARPVNYRRKSSTVGTNTIQTVATAGSATETKDLFSAN